MDFAASQRVEEGPLEGDSAPPKVPATAVPARFRSIDVLRGIAATLVAMRHAFDGPFMVGAIGVDIFFVISGFVMAKVSVGRTAGEFLADRAWRIFPAYWVALAACFLFALLQGTTLSYRDTLSSILLFPNWLALGGLYLGVAWTLLFELFFYVAVATGIRLRDWRVPLMLFIAAVAFRPFTGNAFFEFAGSPIMIEFLFGMLIALLPRDRRIGGALLAAALVFILCFPSPWLQDYRLAMSYQPAFIRVALWGVPAAMIVYGALTFEEKFEGRMVRALLVLGAASYSIYLWHMIVIKMIFPDQPLVGFVSSMIVGTGMWRFVERRLMKMKPAALIASLQARGNSFSTAAR